MALTTIDPAKLSTNAVDRMTLAKALKTLRDESEAVHILARPGVPMQNRLRMLGAPGAIAAGDYLDIGDDTYEFRDDTPPTGGTAGRIWVYAGATSAVSRENFVNAVNGVVDAATIGGDSVATENVLAFEGITTGDVVIVSADAVGGDPVPSATAIACTENLTTATDIWDAANTYLGEAAGISQLQLVTITINAAMIAKGTVEAQFDFTPLACILVNRMRPQNEAFTISDDCVSLTLAGGGSPNNQDTDVIDIIAIG